MRVFADQPPVNNRTSFEWRNNEERDSNLLHKKYAVNDMNSHETSNHTNHSDNIHCWGDAPKRKTRLLDVLVEGDRRTISSNNTTNFHKLKLRQHPTETINSSGKPSTAPRQAGCFSSPSQSCSDSSTGKLQEKVTSGRERLLEWLRASQAKRDENNRQVFTRWVDRVEGVTGAEPNPSDGNTIPSTLKATGGGNFNLPPSVLPPATLTGFPGVLTTPTFLVGNSMTVFPTQTSLSRPQHACSNSIPMDYLPTVLTCKPQMTNNGIAACGVLPQLVPVTGPKCNFDSLENVHGELKSVTPDHAKQEILSQTNTNAQNCTSSLTNYQGENQVGVCPVSMGLPTSPYATDLGVHQMTSDGYPGTTAQTYCDPMEHNIYTEQQLMPFALQPHPYYVTLPANTDLYYPYYFYRTQIPGPLGDMTLPEGSQIDSRGQTTAPETRQLSVCYVQPPGGSSSQYPGTAHQVFVADGTPVYMPSFPISPGPSLPCGQTNDLFISSTTFTMQDYRDSRGELQTSEPYNFSTADREVDQQQPISISSADGSVYTSESSQECCETNESIAIHDEHGGGALEFDVHKWYSVLDDMKVIAQTNVQDGTAMPQ